MQLMLHFLNSLYNVTTTVHSYFFPVSKGWKNEVRLKHFKGGSIPSLLLSGCLTHNLDQYAKNLHNVKKQIVEEYRWWDDLQETSDDRHEGDLGQSTPSPSTLTPNRPNQPSGYI